jgi:hypothetical protein
MFLKRGDKMLFSTIRGARTLRASVKNWLYQVQLLPDEEKSTGRLLTIICQTIEAHFLPSMELDIEISEDIQDPQYDVIRDEENQNLQGKKAGEAVRRASDPEHHIPEFVMCGMEVGPSRFNYILDILRARHEDNLEVAVSLSLFGLDLSDVAIELDRWPPGLKLAVLNVEFILQPSTKKTC